MTDILTSLTLFALWSVAYLSVRYDWSVRLRLLVGGPLALLAILQWWVPLKIAVPVAIGDPLNLVLRLGTLGVTLLFFFRTVRSDQREERRTEGV